MEIWKRNLVVCWISMFIVSSGMSQMAPILPLYIDLLGIHDPSLNAQWAGIVFGSNFITLTIFSPIWGKFADKYGRKPMLLRASLWLAIILTSMGFVQNVYQLTGLRFLQGAMSGFQSAAITLVATQTPRNRSGWALGTLSTGQVGGSLLGPLLGGFLAETIGMREMFVAIGLMCLFAFFASLLFVKEVPVTLPEKALGFKAVWRSIPHPGILASLFVTTLVMQLALMSIQPIITLYICQLSADTAHVAMVSGAVFAASGFASMLAAPFLGKLSDRVGPEKVIFWALVVAGVVFVPQALVTDPLQLGVLRFLLGLATAGLLPSINSLIKKSTPDNVTGRAFGYNQSAQFLGMFLGSIIGGQVAAAFSIPFVFYLTGALLLLNAIWVLGTVYKPNFNG